VARPSASGPAFSRTRADHIVRFIENLTLSTDGIASQAGAPFVLRPWQKRIVRELFGRTRDTDTSRRAYRTAFIALPRKNGKSELCAALALYGLVGEDIKGGQVYSAAAEKEQAALVFNAAKTMVEADPELSARIKVLATNKRMVDQQTGSIYQALSAEAYSKHGFNASMVIYDELHAAPNRELWDVLRTSMGARKEPLMVAITTAGFDKASICWELWEYARKVRDGAVVDPAFFQVLYESDPAADWTDERVWREANPALGDFRDIDEMRALAHEAQSRPEAQNTFRRLYLNQWTEQETRWLDMHKWDACPPVDERLAAGRASYAGLDLGLKSDMSAFVAVTPLEDGRVLVRCCIWMPEGARERFHGRPYATWQQAGALTITEGDVTDFGKIVRDVEALCDVWDVRELAYDERFAAPVVQQFNLPDVTLIQQPQGYALNVGLRSIEDRVVAGTLGHNGQPVLTWMAGNAVVETGTRGDIAVSKRKVREKVDGVVALAMALQRAMLAIDEPPSVYETRGVLSL
jgi:phage terminase large subunit-like protein